MNKIKDFFYNITDIIIAIFILVLIIFGFWYEVGGFFVDNLPDEIGEKIPLPVSNLAREITGVSPAIDDKIPSTDKENIKDDNIKNTKDIESTSKSMTTEEKFLEEMAETPEIAKNENTNNIDYEDENKDDSKEINNNQNKKNPPESNEEVPNPNADITINIPSGSTSEDIAKILHDNGIIQDTNQFVVYLIENNIDTRIHAGTFTFKQNMSLEDISNILTK